MAEIMAIKFVVAVSILVDQLPLKNRLQKQDPQATKEQFLKQYSPCCYRLLY